MEDLKILASSISQIAEEKGISYDTLIGVIEQASAAAYKKDNDRKGENIQAKLNPETGEIKFWQILEVVNEDMIYSEEELEELKDKQETQREKITEDNIRSIRPGYGLHPKYYKEILGKISLKFIKRGTPLSSELIEDFKEDKNA